MKQKLFTFFLTLIASVSAIYASDTQVDGIWYDFDNDTQTASVTYRGYSNDRYDDEYSGLVVIPSSVTYNGTTYSVTSIGELAFAYCSSLTSVTIPNSVTSIEYGAFAYCSSLPSVTIGESVTNIGGYAFYGCSSLASVTIPNSVTSIGEEAFGECTFAKDNFINYSTLDAEANYYWGATVVEGNEINGLFIRNNTVIDCRETVTSVEIPNSVTSIGEWAFSDCSSLTSVTIPNSVKSIGSRAFSWCSSLTSITCEGENPPTVGSDAFYGVSTSIPVYVPCGCVGAYKAKSGWKDFINIQEPLAEYSIEVNVNDTIMGTAKVDINSACGNQISATPNIGYHFVQWSDGNTKNPRTLELTQDTILIAEFALTQSGQCGDNLYWELIDDTLHITGTGEMYDYISDTTPWKRSIKALCIGESVTSIGSWAFRKCSSLTSVTIPNSVTSIGRYAFSSCYSLTSVTIPNSVKSIGDDAFSYCSSLTSVTIPNSVTSIGSWAFSDCSSLTSVTIPNSVTSIGEWAFSDCSSLTSVTIPNSVKSIGSRAFDDCSSLTSVTIGNSVTSIGEWAFYDCSSLAKTNYTGDVAGWCNIKFGDGEANPMCHSHNFYINDQEIKDLVIPNSVTSIGSRAFDDCSSLTSVTIGNSVTSIGSSAFDDCSSLTSVTIGESVTNIGGYAFYGCSSLTSVTIPNSVTSIGSWAFRNCSSLTSVTINSNAIVSKDYSDDSNISHIFGSQVTEYIIGDEVKSIGNGAFSWCSSLTSVTIGESVTSIGKSAFYECSKLASMTCEAITPPSFINSRYTFYGVSKSIPVYVPCGCVEAYNTAGAWGNFTNIQEPLLEYSIEVYVNDTIMGSAKVDYNTFCEGNQISATPNIGYHFVQWNDGNTDAIRTLELTQDTILTAEFAQSFSGQCGNSLYWELIETTLHITGSGEMYNYTSDTAPWKLLISSIKSLTIAEDVTSIERLAFSDCTAIESIVWNAKNYTNPANKEAAPFYDIRSQIKSFTFGENVEHIPAYLCYGMDKLTSVTTPNSLKTIGTSAFEGCIRLSKISLGTGLEEIAANAFAGCTRLYDIYVYATYPPFADESSFANYNVYVYIPCEYQRDYTLDMVWGKFKFIECINSEEATTDGNVTIVPGYNDVTITWPTEDNADNYAIVIEKDGEVFCTLTFNADGQLLNIAFAPARNSDNRPVQYAEQAVSGYRFTVTGLTEATRYAYNVTTKDAANKTIATYSGEFTTKGGITTAVEDILHSTTNCQKLLRNGQLIIIRDGKTYNVMGKAL